MDGMTQDVVICAGCDILGITRFAQAVHGVPDTSGNAAGSSALGNPRKKAMFQRIWSETQNPTSVPASHNFHRLPSTVIVEGSMTGTVTEWKMPHARQVSASCAE